MKKKEPKYKGVEAQIVSGTTWGSEQEWQQEWEQEWCRACTAESASSGIGVKYVACGAIVRQARSENE